jgi:hypothetical protein
LHAFCDKNNKKFIKNHQKIKKFSLLPPSHSHTLYLVPFEPPCHAESTGATATPPLPLPAPPRPTHRAVDHEISLFFTDIVPVADVTVGFFFFDFDFFGGFL